MGKNIAIFASGNGTNAENIIRYFQGSSKVKVKLVLTNRLHAFALERVRKLNVPHAYFDKEDWGGWETGAFVAASGTRYRFCSTGRFPGTCPRLSASGLSQCLSTYTLRYCPSGSVPICVSETGLPQK